MLTRVSTVGQRNRKVRIFSSCFSACAALLPWEGGGEEEEGGGREEEEGGEERRLPWVTLGKRWGTVRVLEVTSNGSSA